VSRYLFVVPPLVGHVNPTVGVAAKLAARGHEVAWTGPPALVRPLVGPHATVLPLGAENMGRRSAAYRTVAGRG
jgi:UDP:flavonoid glycosyltransferase YjiC (YdhE family)